MSPQNSEREIADLETEIASVRKLLQRAELQAEGGHFGRMKAISQAFGGAKPGDLSAMAEGRREASRLRRELRELESRRQQLKETNPAVADDKREKEIGLELWNSGATRTDPPLSENAAAILSELWALKATADNPQTRETIATRLRWAGDGKRAFDPLKKLGYVASCRHGYYLTEAGKNRAERLR